MLAQLSPGAGERPSRPLRATPPSGQGERNTEPAERPEKSVLCGRDDLGSMDIMGKLSRQLQAPQLVPRSSKVGVGEMRKNEGGEAQLPVEEALDAEDSIVHAPSREADPALLFPCNRSPR